MKYSTPINGILDLNSTDFFQGRSTATNLSIYQNYLVNTVEGGFQVDSIYTDLSRAFDSVIHPLLIKKLSEIGISGNYLTWIKSYLSGRSQRVEVCGSLSRMVQVTSGVPQGSHLGPVLFLLFINDVTSCFRSSCVLLYADDLKFYGVVDSNTNALQSDLDMFVSWCSSNYLKINVSKCRSISFHKNDNPVLRTYSISDQTIQSVDSISDLGVVFQSDLRFNLHIDNIITKSLRLLGFIKRNSKYITDTKAITCLYNSLVRSILEYCSIIWAPYYALHNNRLKRVQNKFLKYLLYKHHFPCSGLPYSTRLLLCGIKSLEERRRDALLLFLFKIFNNLIDCDELLGMITLKVPLRRTRQQLLFHQTHHRTNYGQSAFVDRMITNYNQFFNNCDIFNHSLPKIKKQIISMSN